MDKKKKNHISTSTNILLNSPTKTSITTRSLDPNIKSKSIRFNQKKKHKQHLHSSAVFSLILHPISSAVFDAISLAVSQFSFFFSFAASYTSAALSFPLTSVSFTFSVAVPTTSPDLLFRLLAASDAAFAASPAFSDA